MELKLDDVFLIEEETEEAFLMGPLDNENAE